MTAVKMQIQVVSSKTALNQAEQTVEYQAGTEVYSAIFSDLTSGKHNVTIYAVSNGKTSRGASRQCTLGVYFICNITRPENINECLRMVSSKIE